jgi:hypothetical protein
MRTGEFWIDINAGGWLWNHWSSVSHKKLLDREHSVWSVIMNSLISHAQLIDSKKNKMYFHAKSDVPLTRLKKSSMHAFF